MTTYTISVGGSMIVPELVDTAWVKEFKEFILKRVNNGDKFILVCGGGKTCRNYQNAAKEISADVNNTDLDWIGIKTTWVNAELIKAIFSDIAHPKVIIDPTEDIKFDEKILVAAGWKPGWSTDYDAVLLAEKCGSKQLANLSNIDYVYDDNPRENPNAKIIEKMTWDELQNIVGSEWKPGLNAPFDPIAAKKAKELDLSVGIINGKNLESLNDFFDQKEFKGTIISN